MLKPSVTLSFCMVVGVLAGLGGYTFHYAAGTSYFSADSAACVNCHIMREQYDGWQACLDNMERVLAA